MFHAISTPALANKIVKNEVFRDSDLGVNGIVERQVLEWHGMQVTGYQVTERSQSGRRIRRLLSNRKINPLKIFISLSFGIWRLHGFVGCREDRQPKSARKEFNGVPNADPPFPRPGGETTVPFVRSALRSDILCEGRIFVNLEKYIPT